MTEMGRFCGAPGNWQNVGNFHNLFLANFRNWHTRNLNENGGAENGGNPKWKWGEVEVKQTEAFVGLPRNCLQKCGEFEIGTQ
jgi:hypothetical protein